MVLHTDIFEVCVCVCAVSYTHLTRGKSQTSMRVGYKKAMEVDGKLGTERMLRRAVQLREAERCVACGYGSGTLFLLYSFSFRNTHHAATLP